MDWMEVIGAHVMWKQRLIGLLAGKNTEALDPAAIRLDNRCALGKWIYGDGASMSQLPKYDEVRELHAQFHQFAADIVELHVSGNTADAGDTSVAGQNKTVTAKGSDSPHPAGSVTATE